MTFSSVNLPWRKQSVHKSFHTASALFLRPAPLEEFRPQPTQESVAGADETSLLSYFWRQFPSAWNKWPQCEFPDHTKGTKLMLKWALIFLVISLISGFLGFSGISAATATIAKVLFFIALALFLI